MNWPSARSTTWRPISRSAAAAGLPTRSRWRRPCNAPRDSYRLDKVLAEPLRLVLGTTMATIRTLQRQLVALDKTIAQELAAIPQTLSTVPGLGSVWSVA